MMHNKSTNLKVMAKYEAHEERKKSLSLRTLAGISVEYILNSDVLPFNGYLTDSEHSHAGSNTIIIRFRAQSGSKSNTNIRTQSGSIIKAHWP